MVTREKTFSAEGAIVELLLDSATGEVTVAAQKVGPMLAGGSELSLRVEEALASAARDDGSRPQYSDWRSYSFRRALPGFPVTVSKPSL